jgi:hypothetical protein
MDLAALKARVQDHLRDGLVTIVGSGLSCAEGLPGMNALASHLESAFCTLPPGPLANEWATVKASLGTKGLEQALLDFPPSADLEERIRIEVAAFVSGAEREAISEVFMNGRVLRFTRLLKHLLVPSSGIQIVTTNYDRLLEVASEQAGLGVDTMFSGVFSGRLNERESRLSFCRDVTLHNGKPRFHYADRVVLSKPHGSLDWYDQSGNPVRNCSDLISASRLIIPPGQNKYRNGYNSPFDAHRERANRAIDRASRFLIIGYGFNDIHLETHLKERIKSGVPIIVLAYALTPNARAILNLSSQYIAMEHAELSGRPATRVYTPGATDLFAGYSLWDVEQFVHEVFEP